MADGWIWQNVERRRKSTTIILINCYIFWRVLKNQTNLTRNIVCFVCVVNRHSFCFIFGWVWFGNFVVFVVLNATQNYCNWFEMGQRYILMMVPLKMEFQAPELYHIQCSNIWFWWHRFGAQVLIHRKKNIIFFEPELIGTDDSVRHSAPIYIFLSFILHFDEMTTFNISLICCSKAVRLHN